MRIALFLLLILSSTAAHAQQIVLMCTRESNNTLSCIPVSASNPLPVK